MNDTAQLLPFRTSQGRQIFYKFQKGQGDVAVFLNGLDDSTQVWESTVISLAAPQPRLFVDLMGQGASLKAELESGEEYSYQISAAEQGTALLELFAFLGIKKRIIIGNSYGGGVALWLASQEPELTEKLVLINPFVLRLDLSFPLARAYAFQYKMLRRLTPAAFQSPFQMIENSYEKFIHNYMHYRFKNRIGSEEMREASVALSRGMMEFNSFEVLENLPEQAVYLIFSELDTLVPRSLYQEFWLRLPPGKKRNALELAHGDHLILEQAPLFVCGTLDEILQNRMEPQMQIKICWSEEETSATKSFSR